MGTPGQPIPTLELPPLEKREVECPICKQQTEQVMPTTIMVNSPTMSAFMVPHDAPCQCTKCGNLFTCLLLIKGYSLQWIAAIPNRKEVVTPSHKIILPS